MTMVKFQRLYREGRVSSERATIERLEGIVELNDSYRAILEVNPDALFIARELKGFFRGSLHGIPMVETSTRPIRWGPQLGIGSQGKPTQEGRSSRRETQESRSRHSG